MKNLLKSIIKNKSSMSARLFAFLLALVFVMSFCVIGILLSTGALTVGSSKAERFVREEFSVIKDDLTAFCGNTSVQLVLLSQSLSKSIEYKLTSRNLDINKLKNDSNLLEAIVSDELGRLMYTLEKTQCSGVFMILDATVNPSLENAENSKAGLYIRYTEPKVMAPDEIRLVRGSSKTAFQNSLFLYSQWNMEFDVKDCSFYHLPIDKYAEKPLASSQLCYWAFENIYPEFEQDTILCSVPLIDSNGKAFGVCGFEISVNNFQTRYSPDDSEYKHVFSMISLISEDGIDSKNALFSKNYMNSDHEHSNQTLQIISGNGINTYTSKNGETLVGLHEEIKMYPTNSAFSDQHFAVSLFMPKEDLDAAAAKANLRFITICVALLVLCIGISWLISKKYLSPITKAISVLNTDNADGDVKTNIVEIDKLIEKIRSQRPIDSPLPENLFEDFMCRVKTLTSTELTVFQHIVDGKSNTEITNLMFITMNTLRVHNRHIYAKLDVSSKDELLLYAELMDKSGLSAATS